MYAQNNQAQELGQYLVNYIEQQAQAGPVQNYVWQMASQNNYQNEFFQQRLNTLLELVQMWSSGGGQIDINQALTTVYYCVCGTTVARTPQLSQQMNQPEYDGWMQWANQAQQLSAEISHFMAQFQRPQYNVPNPAYGVGGRGRPQAPVHNAWDAAQQQQQGGWGYPSAPSYGRGPANPTAHFATASQVPAARASRGATPAPSYKPRSGGTAGMRGRYGNRDEQQPVQRQPVSRPVTQVSSSGNNQPPNFTQPRSGTWRSRNNQSNETRFNPDDPRHAPVGRQVAEAHEHAANARASWDVSDHDWDNQNTIGFNDDMEAPPQSTRPSTLTVKPNHSKEPQFMERLSSNPDVPNLLFGRDTDDGYFEFTIEDWRTNPDPDFPWEIGYTPSTRTRRIAFDVKRNCYVQRIEENAVKYEDHEIVDKSAAVKSTAATRARPPRDAVNVDESKVITLGELTAHRQSVIDKRLDAVKETWEHQEEAARQKSKETNSGYVAPELSPSREEAIDTPTPNETEDDALVMVGRLTEQQIVTVDLGTESVNNEAQALYAAQAKLALEHFDSTDVPLLIAKYVETTPFLLNVDEAAHALDKLKLFTKEGKSKNMKELAEHLKNIVDDIPTLLWNAIDAQLTDYVNSILHTELGLTGVSIESFAEDAPALPQYLTDKKAPKFMEALGRHVAEFVSPMICLSIPAGSEELNDRTVLLRRESVLAKLDHTSQELGVYADKAEFVITASSAPNIHKLIGVILKQSAREDGQAGYHKRVLLLEDGMRFTLHQGWMGDDSVYILKR
jgi:hypothetical protein